jgi:hypothetical protein
MDSHRGRCWSDDIRVNGRVDRHPKEIPMRTLFRLAVALVVAVSTIAIWQAAAIAATAIEYGLVAP